MCLLGRSQKILKWLDDEFPTVLSPSELKMRLAHIVEVHCWALAMTTTMSMDDAYVDHAANKHLKMVSIKSERLFCCGIKELLEIPVRRRPMSGDTKLMRNESIIRRIIEPHISSRLHSSSTLEKIGCTQVARAIECSPKPWSSRNLQIQSLLLVGASVEHPSLFHRSP